MAGTAARGWMVDGDTQVCRRRLKLSDPRPEPSYQGQKRSILRTRVHMSQFFRLWVTDTLTVSHKAFDFDSF